MTEDKGDLQVETDDDLWEKSYRRKEWILLFGMVIAIAGILAMAKLSDGREQAAYKKVKEAEDKAAAAQIESEVCWKGFKARLEEVIRFRCPAVKGDRYDH